MSVDFPPDQKRYLEGFWSGEKSPDMSGCQLHGGGQPDMSGDFSPDQKRYLEGFVSGLNAARATRGVLAPGATGEPTGPDAIHLKAQDRVTAGGGQPSGPEEVKGEQPPLAAYREVKETADSKRPAPPPDNV